MTRNHAVLAGPFSIALFGIIFCVWSAFGNDVNFCVTTGCTLYQDFTIAGISLWWFGTASFTILAGCSLLGQAGAGKKLAALFLFGDICLLLLMAVTAPCVSCLVAALLFALCYFLFRRSDFFARSQKQPAVPGRSMLLLVWTLLFFINIGQVARSQLDVWPILDESGDAHMRMFFSPSCKYCIEGINVLSGNVNTAFYPVAENDADIFRLAKIKEFLDQGMSLAEAMGQSEDVEAGSFLSSLRPEFLLLRLRLLINKAHIFGAGSSGVPFFEICGLPPSVQAKVEERGRKPAFRATDPNGRYSGSQNPPDERLPMELGDFGQCGGAEPCPPGN